jgi:hypothetical protein
MTRGQASAYLGIANRTAQVVYVQQHRTRPPALPESVIGGFDEYDFPSRWKQQFLRTVPFSDPFFEAGFSVSRHAETRDRDRYAERQ